MPWTVALAVNPAAGGGRAGRLMPAVTAHLSGRGVEVRTVVGRGAAHAEALLRQVAPEVDAVVALGGDGMVALALQVVAGTATPLGIVPAGTGNDVARALRLPRNDPRAAADVVVDGVVRALDLGRVESAAPPRWFAGVLATGFDTLVNERANRMRRPRGRSRYHLALVAELRRLGSVPYELVVDGTTHRVPATLVAVGNGPSYGGGLRIAPDADLADGVLDLTLVGPLSRRRLVRVFPELYPGTFVRYVEVRRLRGRQVSIDAPAGVAYADGERVGPLPVRAQVVPAALQALVPASTGGAS